MKIESVECYFRSMKLSEPYSIAYETVDRCENVFIHISTDNGHTGWGCAAPDLHVTGESGTDVLHSFNKVIDPFLKGKEVFQYAFIMETLKELIPDKPAARAMVDMALFDMMAQKAGVPLFKFLGGYRKSIATSITIGIMPVKQTLAFARLYLKKGFRILKIKGGKDVLEDIERINRLREVVGRHVVIRFDANQGYTLQDSLDFLEGTKKTNIELLEQPTQKKDIESLKQLTRRSSVPVMADESLLSLNDVFCLSKEQGTDLINIKLMKTGGILEAMHINSVARAAGIGAMVGCMDESSLGIAAGLHFALSRPNIQYADLDGHLDLVDDPFEGMLRIEDGELIPPGSAGIGWTGLKKIRL
jgi:L-alanine-DL-glutamate epimerase-like enolase superfamily enzyme